ncbi:MAG: hypothetical protein ABIM21_04080 [candidate division WOR-3 bacterium]
MNVIIAVVVTVIILLIIAVFALYVRGYGAEALSNLFNVGKYIECLIRKVSDPNFDCSTL